MNMQPTGKKKEINLRAEEATTFSGKAQRTLASLYGDPRVKGWGYKWMLIWNVQQDFPWFPASRIYIHKDFKLKLAHAFISWKLPVYIKK